MPYAERSESGLTFWTIAPLPEPKTVGAFHWLGNSYAYAVSTESGLAFDEIEVSSCPLLGARLVQLREAVLESVEMVFDRKPVRPSTTIHLDGPLYRVSYAPDRHTTTVILEGGMTERLTWITAALEVQQRVTACTAGNATHR